jgi:hypothetical protein
VVLGVLLGLIIGWGIWPVQWTDATPEVLRADLQVDNLRMIIDSYNRTGDTDTAMARWDNLGEAANSAYLSLQTDPGYLNPADIQAFGALVQSVRGVPPGQSAPSGGTSTGMGSLVLYASIVVLAWLPWVLLFVAIA